MRIHIRQAEERDLEHIVSFSKKLSDFNWENHSPACKYDDYELVMQAVGKKWQAIFQNKDENILFLVAENDQKPLGYLVARIYEEDRAADAGTGRVGLIEKLFLSEEARGDSLGQKLMDEVMGWFQSKDVRRVRVEPYAWNERAKAFYEKNGFMEYSVVFEKFI